MNPALDVSAVVDRVEPDKKLRTEPPTHEAGGGGVNVAKAARSLGADTHLVVALGGHTGGRVEDLLEADGGSFGTVALAAETRQSVTIRSESSGRQYRFVFPGPPFGHEEVERFASSVIAAAGDASLVVLSGSLAPGIDPALYRNIIEQIDDIPVIVDTSGAAFVQASRSNAALLKPSVTELSTVVGRRLGNETEYVAAARELLATGKAACVAVSLGPGGALLVWPTGPVVRVRPPAVRQVSAVGAGDSMVAATAVELEKKGDVVAAVRAGVAAGTAAVLTPGSQLCRPEDVAQLSSQVVVEELPSA